MEVVANVIVVIIFQDTGVSNHHLYTLNLHSATCPLYINEGGGGNKKNILYIFQTPPHTTSSAVGAQESIFMTFPA